MSRGKEIATSRAQGATCRAPPPGLVSAPRQTRPSRPPHKDPPMQFSSTETYVASPDLALAGHAAVPLFLLGLQH